MKIVKPSFEIWEQSAGLEGVYKQIEKVGRVCYKSEDKITEDSAKPFVDRMIKSGHGAMLEHGTVYMFMPIGCDKHDYHVAHKYYNNKYSKVIIRNEHFLLNKNGYYITTNLRVLVENEWMDDLKYICDLTEFHEKRITVHFVCDRGVSHEFVRHRVMSFAQESTRYCNYSKDKFGNELTFIIPCWLDIPTGHYAYWDGDWCDIDKMKIQLPEGEHKDIDAFLWTLNNAETHYTLLINSGWKPQEARAVLPNSLKTELVVTGFTSDWNHFFDLRARGTTGAPHPQAKELAEPLMKEFIARKYINN
nr:MAG TPA: Thymidylate synthase complementing protein [Crassvirales sp.]